MSIFSNASRASTYQNEHAEKVPSAPRTTAADYLEVLAAVAAQQDDPQRAVRLLVGARSILAARGSGWLHAFIPRVPHDDAALAGLRSRIGDAAFDQAQARGRSAGSKRAVKYALQKP